MEGAPNGTKFENLENLVNRVIAEHIMFSQHDAQVMVDHIRQYNSYAEFQHAKMFKMKKEYLYWLNDIKPVEEAALNVFVNITKLDIANPEMDQLSPIIFAFNEWKREDTVLTKAAR